MFQTSLVLLMLSELRYMILIDFRLLFRFSKFSNDKYLSFQALKGLITLIKRVTVGIRNFIC